MLTAERLIEREMAVAGEDAGVYIRLCGRRKLWTDWPFARSACSLGVRSGCALDVGCGPGHVATYLARNAPGLRVWAFDLSTAMLQNTGKVAKRAGVASRVVPVRGDMRALPFPDGSFDLVVSQYAFHHLPDVGAALDEIGRVLKPGGTVLIRDFLRPRSDWQVSMLLNMARFMIGVDAEGREQYRDSLLAGFSLDAVREQVACSRLRGAEVRTQFPSHFVIKGAALQPGAALRHAAA